MFLAEVYLNAFEEASKVCEQRNKNLFPQKKFFDRKVLPVVKEIEGFINQDPDVNAFFRIQENNFTAHRLWHDKDRYSWRFQVLFANKKTKQNLGTATLLLDQESPHIAKILTVAKVNTIRIKNVGGLQRIARFLLTEAAEKLCAESFKPQPPKKKISLAAPKV